MKVFRSSPLYRFEWRKIGGIASSLRIHLCLIPPHDLLRPMFPQLDRKVHLVHGPHFPAHHLLYPPPKPTNPLLSHVFDKPSQPTHPSYPPSLPNPLPPNIHDYTKISSLPPPPPPPPPPP